MVKVTQDSTHTGQRVVTVINLVPLWLALISWLIWPFDLDSDSRSLNWPFDRNGSRSIRKVGGLFSDTMLKTFQSWTRKVAVNLVICPIPIDLLANFIVVLESSI